jgi:hypothetical protein
MMKLQEHFRKCLLQLKDCWHLSPTLGGGGYFITLRVCRLHSKERYCNWTFNWKGVGRKMSWSDWDTVSAFSWRDCAELRIASVLSNQDSGWPRPEFMSGALLLQQPAQCCHLILCQTEMLRYTYTYVQGGAILLVLYGCESWSLLSK